MFMHVVVYVYQEMSKFRSQFCDCCCEERWVTNEYVENERGESFCRKCMTSINSIETPLFSATNNMVGSTLLRNLLHKHTRARTKLNLLYVSLAQIPGVLPPELRNCTPLEYRITSPAAVIMQIYCVRGTG